MELFHGSYTEVSEPKILSNQRTLDFGAGFYLTSNVNQAIRWAKSVSRRRKIELAMVNKYSFAEKNFENLKVLDFPIANGEWLDFVVSNRQGKLMAQEYDLIVGPVADDSTLRVINDYMDGVYSKDEAVHRLLPQNLTDQYAFLTDKSLQYLTFVEGSKL
ncbi:MAG: DUF3990 domain-containing protein [Lactobacillaceae bacterium]|jgi:hypothetical protein|nr:DUF3990 domain-containing protein [Lactobacillaceae bacterium]